MIDLKQKLIAAKSLLSRYENAITANLQSSNGTHAEHMELIKKRDKQYQVFIGLRDAYREERGKEQ